MRTHTVLHTLGSDLRIVTLDLTTGRRLSGLERRHPQKYLSCQELRTKFQWDYRFGSPAKRGLGRSRVRFVVTACSSYSTNTSRRIVGLRAAIVRRGLAA